MTTIAGNNTRRKKKKFQPQNKYPPRIETYFQIAVVSFNQTLPARNAKTGGVNVLRHVAVGYSMNRSTKRRTKYSIYSNEGYKSELLLLSLMLSLFPSARATIPILFFAGKVFGRKED